MFIGHFAVGFAAKKLDPRPSLATYFIASQFLDLLWPVLLLLGVEHVRIDPGNTRMTPLDFYDYPISHSLVSVGGWVIIAIFASYWIYRKVKISLLLGACVFSHWFLDLIVHRPDLPITFNGGPYFGFSLWNYPFVTLPLETTLFVTGAWLYWQSTFAKDLRGKLGLSGLITILLLIQCMNLIGPPPPNVQAIAIAGNLQWLFVVIAFWVDKHRKSKVL